MAKIITVAHQKGGVGKSTLTLNLGLLFQAKLRTAIIDTDLQGSLIDLKNINLTVLNNIPADEIPLMDFDLILIDTPPYLSDILRELLLISDFVLVPSKAGFFDAMAIHSTLGLINDAMSKNGNLKSGIVLNMIKNSSSITSEVKCLFNNSSTPLLNTIIHDRVSFTRSPMTGGILNSDDDRAIEEIYLLAEEILNKIK